MSLEVVQLPPPEKAFPLEHFLGIPKKFPGVHLFMGCLSLTPNKMVGFFRRFGLSLSLSLLSLLRYLSAVALCALSDISAVALFLLSLLLCRQGVGRHGEKVQLRVFREGCRWETEGGQRVRSR